jgi:formate dehydrogenase major subunit/formate dehydrogenase alpha subunit
MTNSIADLSMAEVLLLIGSNTTTAHPVIAMQLNQALKRGMKLIVIDPRKTTLARRAHLHLQIIPGTDVAILKAIMRVIVEEGLADEEFLHGRVEGYEEFKERLNELTLQQAASICGVPAEKIVKAARLYAGAGRAAVAYCLGVTQHAHGTDNVRSVANLAMLTGNIGRPGTGVNPLRGANNVQGCCDVGGLPDLLPGYQRVEDPQARARFESAWGVKLDERPGLTVTEMIDAANAGEMKAMYIMGENPVISDPDANHVVSGLKNLDFLVVQDIFLTETAQLAHVVLPGVTFAEKNGTFTNTERRVQRVRKAIQPVGSARPDWQIIRDIANLMGAGWSYESPKDVMNEVRDLVTQYGGIRYGRIDKQGIQWPCPKDTHPGTTILHAETFICGKGKMAAVNFIEPSELPDEEYPFIFNTGRSLYHFHTGSMTRRSRSLDELMPVARVDINPADANQLKISDGDKVKVISRRGKIVATAAVTDTTAEGAVFLPFHFAEAAANLLTNTARDPVCKIPELKVCAVRIEKIG